MILIILAAQRPTCLFVCSHLYGWTIQTKENPGYCCLRPTPEQIRNFGVHPVRLSGRFRIGISGPLEPVQSFITRLPPPSLPSSLPFCLFCHCIFRGPVWPGFLHIPSTDSCYLKHSHYFLWRMMLVWWLLWLFFSSNKLAHFSHFRWCQSVICNGNKAKMQETLLMHSCR